MLSPKAQKVFPLSIESKNTKMRPGPAAMKQAEANCYPNTVAGVAWKPKGKGMHDTVIMLKLDDLCDLIKQIREETS